MWLVADIHPIYSACYIDLLLVFFFISRACTILLALGVWKWERYSHPLLWSDWEKTLCRYPAMERVKVVKNRCVPPCRSPYPARTTTQPHSYWETERERESFASVAPVCPTDPHDTRNVWFAYRSRGCITGPPKSWRTSYTAGSGVVMEMDRSRLYREIRFIHYELSVLVMISVGVFCFPRDFYVIIITSFKSPVMLF